MDTSHDAVVTAWREQAPRLVGALLRMTRDLHLAEDLAHDAMVAALEQWPAAGVPDNPAAWLMAVAKRRAVDHFRRAERHARIETEMAREVGAEEERMPDLDGAVDEIEDDVLRLMLMCCHPALTPESQVALTLRLVGGLTSKEIARAFLVPEPTVVRRITRAKARLAEVARRPPEEGDPAGGVATELPFEVPGRSERRRRLPAILHVIYLIFTEGYAATAGEDWLRPALCDEAIRLGRLVTTMYGGEPEAYGLLGLMWLQSSRAGARTDAAGRPVLLEHQDRRRWDRAAIRSGTESLSRALDAGGRGYYTVQAAIAACHARARSVQDTDWTAIASLYDALTALTASPFVLLNRAVAYGMADGPAVGLRMVDELSAVAELRDHHLLPSVRGDLLARLGRESEARAEFLRAAGLAANDRERTFLLDRAHEVGTPGG